MPSQSITAMKVAFGVRAQYATIALVATFMLTQVIGVVIFSGKAQAIATVTFNKKVVSEYGRMTSKLATDSQGNVYAPDSANHVVRVYNSAGDFVRQFGEPGNGDGQFGSGGNQSPTRLAIDSSDNVYVIDAPNNRVQKFNASGVYVSQFGTAGTGPGELSFAYGEGGIDLDSLGNIYVVDNYQVQKFNASGVYAGLEWGSYGGGDGQFFSPRDLVINSQDEIYVSDAYTEGPFNPGRIQKFQLDGTHVTTMTKTDDHNFYPTLALDTSDNIYAATETSHDILKYDSDLNLLQTYTNPTSGCYVQAVALDTSNNMYHYDCPDPNRGREIVKKSPGGTVLASFNFSGIGMMDNPSDVAWSPDGSYYVSSRNRQQIIHYSRQGYPIKSWGTNGTGDGQFDQPTGIALDSSGNVYVTDWGLNRVQKFTSAGVYITQWGSSGSGNGQFNRPAGIAIDSSNNVYVGEWSGNRVQKFTSTGTYVTKWGSTGSGNGQFNIVGGIDVDQSGNVYVADVVNARVQKFTSTGTYVTKWGTSGTGDGQFTYPYGVSVTPSGAVYVSDVSQERVQKFTSTGTYLTKWGSPGSGNGQFNFTISQGGSGIAVDNDYHVYVTDPVNNRLQIFDDTNVELRVLTGDAVNISTQTATIRLQSNDITDYVSGVYSFEYGTTTSYGQTAAAGADTVSVSDTLQFSSDGWTGSLYHAGVIKDSQGNYYTNASGCRVLKFDSAGNYLYALGGSCGGNSTIQFGFFPNKFAVDSDDNVFIGQTDSQYVLKFSSTGTLLGHIDLGSTNSTASLATDPQGNLFADTNDAAQRIKKFSPAGNLLAEWGGSGAGDGEFSSDAIILATDPQGIVYARNGSGAANRIQVFTNTGTYTTQWNVGESGNLFGVDSGGVVYADASSLIKMYSRAGVALSDFNAPDYPNRMFLAASRADGSVQFASLNDSTITTYARQASSDITGLTCETQYHYRAKAVANGDTAYGADKTLTTGDCLTIITSTLPNGTVDSAYSQSVSTDRGDVTISLSSGSLPPGLSLAASGAITGTPTTAGTYNFVALATDNVTSETDTQALSIVVDALPPDPFAITTTSLPDGQVDAGYQESIETDSGSPVAFSLQSGSLPDGLELDPDGMILGIPTVAGSFSFTLEGDNGATTDTQSYSITIAEADEVIDPDVEPEEEFDPEFPEELEEPDVTDVTPQDDGVEAPKASSPIRSIPTVVAAQNNLFALAKRIPEPIAIGFPWLLLALALILVSIQYYQVHSESLATKRMQNAVANQVRLVEEQNNFVALSTHYLHTPLTVMEGEITLMVKAGTLTESQATKLKATLTSLSAEAEAALAQEEQDELNS